MIKRRIVIGAMILGAALFAPASAHKTAEEAHLSSLIGQSADVVYSRLGSPSHVTNDVFSKPGPTARDLDAPVLTHEYNLADGSRLAIIFDVDSQRVIGVAYDSFAKVRLSLLKDFKLGLKLRQFGLGDDGGAIGDFEGMRGRQYKTTVGSTTLFFTAVFQLTRSDIHYDAYEAQYKYEIPENPEARPVYSWLLTSLCGLGVRPDRVFMSDSERARDDKYVEAATDDPLVINNLSSPGTPGLHMDSESPLFDGGCGYGA